MDDDDVTEDAYADLGSFEEVVRADLDGPGGDWEQVVPSDGVDDRIGEPVRRDLPRGGWREVSLSPRRRGSGRLFAAPTDGGWAVAFLLPGPDPAAQEPGGAPVGPEPRPVLQADPGPERVRPIRAVRRRGLSLTWPAGVRLAADELRPTVILTNSGDRPWAHDPRDAHYVRAWFLDGDGELSGSRWAVYGGGSELLHDLAPGQSLILPAEFGHDVGRPEPGSYRVIAAMPQLDVWSAPTTVEVI